MNAHSLELRDREFLGNDPIRVESGDARNGEGEGPEGAEDRDRKA